MSEVDDWNHHETMSALRASQELVPTAVEAVQDFLKLLNGHEYTDEYIKIVHGFWIQHLCQDVVYASLSRSSQVNPMSTNVVVPMHKPKYPSTESAGASRIELARRLLWGMDIWRGVTMSCDSEPQRVTAGIRKVKSRLISSLSSKSARVWVADPYLHQSVPSQVRIAIQSRRLIRWEEVDAIEMTPESMDSHVRQAAHSAISGNSRADVVKALVPLTIPVALAEALPIIESRTTPRNTADTQLIYTANAHHYDTCFKVATAQMVKDGSRLLVHQHGGGYGIDELHPGEIFDRSVSHCFYTFGWSDHSSGSLTKPLPTAPRGEQQEQGHHYLLMTAENTSEFFRFQSFCMPTHVERCISETSSFLSAIDEGHEIYLRSAPAFPFPTERIVFSNCTLKHTQAKESGMELASRARLVIHNYLGTSWLETLAMNIPTVCFYDPSMYQPRASAQPFVEALARVGVIHYSGKDAAKFVNSLHGDPSAWWRSAEVQEAREAFVARYANFSDNWLEAWQEEFESLLAE